MSLFYSSGMLNRIRLKARISHQLAAASPDASTLTTLRSVGPLDGLSSTTAGASIATPCQDSASITSLRNLVRKAGQPLRSAPILFDLPYPGHVLTLFQHPAHSVPGYRIHKAGCDLSQRDKDKKSFLPSWMWNLQVV